MTRFRCLVIASELRKHGCQDEQYYGDKRRHISKDPVVLPEKEMSGMNGIEIRHNMCI